MVLKINEDEETDSKSTTQLVNGVSSASKPTTSAAAAAAAAPSTSNNNNYYSNEKRSSSSSPSSSSSCSDSSSDFEHSYKSLSSRIGNDYQVDLSDYEVGTFQAQNDIKPKEILVWKPSPKINDQDLENFIFTACTKHAYTIEQALALLCWDSYDFSKAFLHMKSYVPIPNEWTEEDKILFEQAYMFHGKNFSKIKQVLPDKSQASLVKFYYMWKKGRQYTSLIDSNQANSKTNGAEHANSEQAESNLKDDSDDLNSKDDNEDDDTHFANNVNKICCNCDLITNELQSTPKGMLCDPCYAYWKETGGLMRPDIISKSNRPGSSKDDYRGNSFGVNNSREAKNFQKSLRKPPKGIYLNYEELVNLVEVDSDQTFDMLNKKLYCLKKEVQLNKQSNASLVAKLADEVESKIAIDERVTRLYEGQVESPCWTEHDIALVIQGFNKYGNDFAAISQVLQTKSENSIKAFYNYYKDHFNLDKLVLNPKDLKSESNVIYNELTKLNSSDLPTSETLNQQALKEPNSETIVPPVQSTEEPVVKMEESPSEAIPEQASKTEHKSDDNDLILID